MKKRFREPKAKEGELLVKYGKKGSEIDLFYCCLGDKNMRRDAKLLTLAFERKDLGWGTTLRQELEARGYDITSLKFSIMLKKNDAIK